MRLWHEDLLPHLPRQQLLGQHRECCALRGKGWGRNHSVVNYVFAHPHEFLVAYHYRVMDEMKRRGYTPNIMWYKTNYRGTTLGTQDNWADSNEVIKIVQRNTLVYPEHDNKYLQECLENLKNKNINIDFKAEI